MENVPHMAAHRRGRFLDRVRDEFESAGYSAAPFRLNAVEHGVPQRRRRIMIVGFQGRDDVAKLKLEAFRIAISRSQGAGVRLPLASAIGNLPSLNRGEGAFYSAPNRDEGNAPIGVFNHVARNHMDRDVELFGLLAPGETAWDALHTHRATHLMPVRKEGSER